MAKKKKAEGGVNKKLLHKMTAQAMPERPKPMMRLHGEDAKAFFGKKPGTTVSARITGVVQSVGIDEYMKNEPETTIRITGIKASRKSPKDE